MPAPAAWYNTNVAKPEELRSLEDFLNPKWKGRLGFLDLGLPDQANPSGLFSGTLKERVTLESSSSKISLSAEISVSSPTRWQRINWPSPLVSAFTPRGFHHRQPAG
jgi:hypothetical protein